MAISSALGAARPRHSPVIRRRPGRDRVTHGATGLFAVTYGTAGPSLYFALGLVAAHGLGLTPLALLGGGTIFALTVLSYAEGASMFPEAGGAASFARHGLNELASFVAGWATLLAFAVTTAISAVFAVQYLSAFWTPLATPPWNALGGLVVVALIAAARVRGVSPPWSLRAFVLIADLVTQFLLVVLGAVLIFQPDRIAQNVHLGTAPSLGQLAFGIALAMLVFTGIESIGDLPRDARNPDTDVPRAVNLLVGAVFTVFAGVSLVSMMAMPVRRDAAGHFTTLLAQKPPHGHAAAPLLGIVARLPLHVFATGFRSYVGLVGAAALVMVAGIAMSGAARLTCSLSQHYQLPRRVASSHGVFRTPHVAIAVSALTAGALLVPGIQGDEAGFLGSLYVYAAMLAVTIAQLAILALRWNDPHRHRPFRVRGGIPFRGRRIPVTAVIGAIATAAAWLTVFLLPTAGRFVGTAWTALGLVGYAVYRRRHGLSLTARREREITADTGPEIEIEFRSILIPVNTDQPDIPWDMVDVAARLAAEHRALIVLLTFTQIPLGEEMDLELPGLEERVEHLAAEARALSDRYGIRVHTSHLRTREPAESILAEARRRNSEVILLGATGRQRATFKGFARDAVTRRVAAQSETRVMFIQPEPSAA